MSVVPFPSRPTETDPAWLTAEKATIYYVLLRTQPEIKHAPLAWRALLVTQIQTAWREAMTPNAEPKAKADAIALLCADEAQKAKEGYLW